MISLAIILVGSLALAGCSSPTPSASIPATSAPATTATTAPAGTTAPASSTAPPTTSPAKVYNLKFSYHTPTTVSIYSIYFKAWTDAIEKASGGRIQITHYPAASLAKLEDQYDAVTSGLADMALVEPEITPGRFPQAEWNDLPYLFPSAAVGAQVYWDVLQKYSFNTELKDIHPLVILSLPGSQWDGTKPVKTLADFKGLRIRSGGRTESWIIQALGASPVEMSTSDLYSGMERGLVDGAWLTYGSILGFGLLPVTKSVTECNIFSRSWLILMNKKTWDSLPAGLQKIVNDNSGGQASAPYCTAYEKDMAGAKGAIAGALGKAGNPPIATLSADEAAKWKTALMPVWDKWTTEMESKKLPGKAILADVQVLIQKYSAAK